MKNANWVTHIALGLVLGVALCVHLNTLSTRENRKALGYQQTSTDSMNEWQVDRLEDLWKRVWELENPGKDYPIQIPTTVEGTNQ